MTNSFSQRYKEMLFVPLDGDPCVSASITAPLKLTGFAPIHVHNNNLLRYSYLLKGTYISTNANKYVPCARVRLCGLCALFCESFTSHGLHLHRVACVPHISLTM